MECKINVGIAKNCEYAAAGVSELYFANWSSDITVTESTEVGEEGMIATITLPTSEKFYKVDCLTDTISVGSAVVVGGSPDLKGLNHTVAGQFAKLSPEFLLGIDAYVLGKVIVAAVLKNGQVMLLGLQNGLTDNTFDFSSGATSTDTSGISFDYSGIQAGFPNLVVSKSVITALTA